MNNYKLENSRLQREFKVLEGSLYASKITNKYSGLDFIPDGSGSEFTVKFTDGDEFSSKNLKVTESTEKGGRLFFRFEEAFGTTVTLTYRIGKDENTIEKQMALTQSVPKIIDYIVLENIGIINSVSYFTVPEGKCEIDPYYSNLGQPFYIDSLFFGCQFPATKNEIRHGRGHIVYFVGKPVGDKLVCPATVIGAAKSTMLCDLKSAFFEYINKISLSSPARFQFNTWFDSMMDVTEESAEKSFLRVENKLASAGSPPLDGYVVDDGWNNYRASFWECNHKKFPNSFMALTDTAKKLGGELGLWLGPRGGYEFQTSFAKRIEKEGFGYLNNNSKDICVCSSIYTKNVEEFLLTTTVQNDIGYWKIDGMCLNACTDINHDHITGGHHNMYFITELWQKWLLIFKKLHAVRAKEGKKLWINLTCYVQPSPWLLQYVNSVWLQNSDDIGFAKNYENGEQSQMNAEITYRDSIYYNFTQKRAVQMPLSRVYNHEPIYATGANLNYSDSEFKKAVYFNACRGTALNELYLSPSMMKDTKWEILADCISWQKKNCDILKNAMFLGGDPAKNNVYCYASWSDDGEGIIALRNPTNESAPLTLTFNKLMGCPETLEGVHCYNIINDNGTDIDSTLSYDYNSKLDLQLNPFEIKIIQFSKTEKKPTYVADSNTFTLIFRFEGNGNSLICQNDDILIRMNNKHLEVNVGATCLVSQSVIDTEKNKFTIVRERNKEVKLYINNKLDSTAYNEKTKAQISTEVKSSLDTFRKFDEAKSYKEIVLPVAPSKKRRK